MSDFPSNAKSENGLHLLEILFQGVFNYKIQIRISWISFFYRSIEKSEKLKGFVVNSFF